MDKKPICMIEGCNERPLSRGLCSAHYQKALYAVITGKTSWRKLEKDKLAGPSRKNAENPFVPAA